MAITRIKTNQITDLNVTTGKLANKSVTAAKLADNISYGSNFTVTGNLTVSGTTTSVSTTNTRVEDAIIALSSEATGSASVDSGLLINRGSDDNYALIWDESADQFVAANVGAEDGDTSGNVTISSYANFQAGTITFATLNDGTTALTATAAELNLIDGSSAGTIANGKAVIYGSGGEVNATALQIAGSAITATAAELNIMDGDTTVGTDAFAAGDGIVTNDNGTMKQTSVATLDTFLSATTKTLTNKTINSDSNTLTLNLGEGTLTGTTAQFNTALSDGSFTTLAGAETLTNKTLTAPKIANAGFIADANGNELIIFTTTASAVNEITFANAAASGHPTITTTGSDTNINLTLDMKGSGALDVSTSQIINVTDPTANQHAATKSYVDTNISNARSLTIAADSGSDDVVTVGTDTLTFAGTSNEINTTVTDNQIQIGLPDDVTIGSDLTVTGNLTVNGTTTTLSTTNSVVSDSLIELNNGASSNANDLGLIFERGSTGDNAVFAWDESEDKFTLGTTTATGASTGNLTIASGTLVAALEGNADTATQLATARAIALSGDVVGTANFDGTAGISISTTIQADSVALGTDTTGNFVGTITGGNGIASDGATSGEGIAHSLSVDLTDTTTFASDGTASRAVVLDSNGDFTARNITATDIDGILGSNTAAAASVTTLGTSSEATLASAIVQDLTAGRVVLAGTSGAIEDSGNLTFDGSTLAVTGAITASSNVDIADAGSLRVGTGNDFTINHDGADTTVANATGSLVINGAGGIVINENAANVDFRIEGNSVANLFVVDGSQDNIGIGGAPNANSILDLGSATSALILPKGTTAQRPTGVTGQFRYNTTTNQLEYYDNAGFKSLSTDFTLATSQVFNGDNSTVAFTLTSLTGSDSYTVAGVFVMLNGVVQQPTVVYGISGNTLTFTTAPASGDLIEVRKFTTTTTVVGISDTDGDTQVQVEESSDEDIIRFDTAGTERATIDANGITVNAQGDVRFGDSDSSHYVALQAPATVGTNVTFTLPATDGTSGQALITDASGNLSFGAAGAVITNDEATNAERLVYVGSVTSGALTAATQDSGFTYNPSTGTLTADNFNGVASSATVLANARTIGGVSFDGSGNINLPGVNAEGNQNTTGSAATLTTARTIAGNSFDGSANITIASTQLSDTAQLARLAGPTFTGNTSGENLTLSGDLTVNGTTTTLNTSNTVVSDNLIELNNGVSSNANDSGILIERGSTGDNAFIGWDESADKFIFGTTTATGASTGNLTIASGTVVAALEGNADTATKLATARAIALTGAVTGTANFDGSAGISISTTATSDPTITLAGDLSGSATLTNLGNATLTATIAANSVALGTDTTGNYVAAGATSGSGISGSVSSEGGTFTVTSNATNANTGSTIVFRDGSGNFSANVITATTTAARYADLAEKYAADGDIEAGTVVHFAGEGKVASCDTANCRSVAGIISTDPAYLMNSEADGVALAISGRVPCKVTGAVAAGDLMVSAGNGMAMANNDAKIGTVIGKAIEAHAGGEGVIEVLALMM